MRWFPVCLLAVLAACARLPADHAAAATAPVLLAGRVSVVHGHDGFTGRFVWRGGPAGDDVLIESALGTGVARILTSTAGAELLLPDGRHWTAPDAEQLTTRVLGWPLPQAILDALIHGTAAAMDGMDAGWQVTAQVDQRGGRAVWRRIDLRRDNVHVILLADAPETAS